MVIVEGGAPVPSMEGPLASMFEARKQVFVDLLQWDVPVVDGRFEIDQFDDEHALYLIVADCAGRHLGSARLLPTLGPHILADLYPGLSAGPVPRASDTYEITRFCLGRQLGAVRRREVRNRLVSALVQLALAGGIRRFSGVAEVGWLQQVLAFGWDCRPLGPPRAIGGCLLGALEIAITAETPSLLEANGLWAPEPFRLSEFARAA